MKQQNERYTIAKAVQIVIATETMPTRKQAYASIVKNSAKVRLVTRVYNALPGSTIKGCAALVYGLKRFGMMRYGKEAACDILLSGVYHSEQKAASIFHSYVEEEQTIEQIEYNNIYCLYPKTLKAYVRVLGCLPKLYRIARRAARRHDFFVCFHIMNTVLCYIRYQWIIEEMQSKAVFISSNYSPDSVAIASAAHRMNRKVIYMNHVPPWQKTPYLPPVCSDLSIFTSQNVLETYKRRSRMSGQCVFSGVLGKEGPMRMKEETPQAEGLRAGVFLTGLTQPGHVRTMVARLLDNKDIGFVSLRPHPIAIVNDDYSGLLQDFSQKKFEIRNDASAAEHASQSCDFVICGNSGAVMEVLKSGNPVIYDNDMDGYNHDSYGFIEKNLIPELSSLKLNALAAELKQFYSVPDWGARMRYFDGSYGKSIPEVRADIIKAVQALLQE